MEGALNIITNDFTAMPQMRAKMRTERVRHAYRTIFAAKENPFFTEHFLNLDIALFKLVREMHTEPSIGNWEWAAFEFITCLNVIWI